MMKSAITAKDRLKFVNTLFSLLFPISMIFHSSLCAETIRDAFLNAQINGNIQLYYYDIHKPESSDAYATAAGGYLKFTTQNWYDLYFQTSFHTSHMLGPRLNERATSLFNNDTNQSLDVLSEVFIGYRRNQRVLKIGTFRLNTPMMNDDTTRIVPWSYRGISFTSTPRNGLRFMLNHVTHVRTNISKEYTDESASGTIDEGISMLGVQYDATSELSLFGFYYYAPGLYNTAVIQADYKHPISQNLMFCMSGQYFNSHDGGAHAISTARNGGDDIDLVGAKASVEMESLDLGVRYSRNFGESGVLKGYGGNAKVFTSSMIANGRGNGKPEALMLTLRYDLPSTTFGHTELGLKYTQIEHHDPTANDYNAYYAHFRYYMTTDFNIYARYERLTYDDAASDGDYFRLISRFEF